ncbi:beta-ketoacyl-[acyl-carrier-protein] synthase family protein [Salegentibacter mishustinae]|uniref:Beta-ACP synthase n=1 Tax=Salegentibacter mishustinae TaxID=270918 RepID=A0A0Q9Z339_9FLAO|nr:beta-ketoacyl-[acyl-carrier-protein] synthase family protein [Salegentibacter mishustinae]KRG27228.1 beta-ACP synthase [Salegentibacter mishustinae]PNW21462.1 beta-ACP synthase [Salegentibacter mishustinae]PZX62588.1 3-oxoacyl-[acyl-carrier-protein] synthase-1 [Salegentibacter mishustinae]GGW96909.1 beta-ACP synthase [Salegentibacter mishustinae]
MNRGVAVTGMGIISAIGKNTEANYRSLLSKESGISFPEILKTTHKNIPVGEIKISNKSLAEALKLPQDHSFTRTALLGSIAVKEALEQSKIKIDTETGFISGTSVGGIDATENHFKEFTEGKTKNNRFIRSQHPGFTTEKIAEHFGITGFVSTISTACSSGANAIMMGARMIKAGKLKRVIVGGTDCLTKFTLNGFNSLMILSDQHCRSFDENRSGLNLGEGAAYLVLEAEEELKGKTVLGRIMGYGNANDAFHQTASSENGEGAFLAMQEALKIAEINSGKIDYINAHGTATKNNDLSESRAIRRLFGENVPHFSSTKAFTGHSLAAAGALEAVYSLISLNKQQMFPNLNFSREMSETGLEPVTELKEKKLNFILSNSFGFGGNCTSLIFARDEA